MKYSIPGELPGLNEVLDRAKGHWAQYAKLKRDYTLLCSTCAKKLNPVEGGVVLEIQWFCKNKKRDPDNIASAKMFILDGLIVAGVLPNDGWAQIVKLVDTFRIARSNPRIEVTLKKHT